MAKLKKPGGCKERAIRLCKGAPHQEGRGSSAPGLGGSCGLRRKKLSYKGLGKDASTLGERRRGLSDGGSFPDDRGPLQGRVLNIRKIGERKKRSCRENNEERGDE